MCPRVLIPKNIFIPTGIYEKVISTLEYPRVWDTRGVKISALRAGIWHTRERHPRVYPWRTNDPPNTGSYHPGRQRWLAAGRRYQPIAIFGMWAWISMLKKLIYNRFFVAILPIKNCPTYDNLTFQYKSGMKLIAPVEGHVTKCCSVTFLHRYSQLPIRE